MPDPLAHLTSTLDGYRRASTDEERRMFLRAALRGCSCLADALAKGLRLVVQAVTR
jgi:hypothetical protein